MSIAKEAYNAGSAQNGSLGIRTDGAAPCIRADDHPTAIGMNAEPGSYGETYPVEAAPTLTVKHKIGVMK